MKVDLLGGTYFLGPYAVEALRAAGLALHEAPPDALAVRGQDLPDPLFGGHAPPVNGGLQAIQQNVLRRAQAHRDVAQAHRHHPRHLAWVRPRGEVDDDPQLGMKARGARGAHEAQAWDTGRNAFGEQVGGEVNPTRRVGALRVGLDHHAPDGVDGVRREHCGNGAGDEQQPPPVLGLALGSLQGVMGAIGRGGRPRRTTTSMVRGVVHRTSPRASASSQARRTRAPRLALCGESTSGRATDRRISSRAPADVCVGSVPTAACTACARAKDASASPSG